MPYFARTNFGQIVRDTGEENRQSPIDDARVLGQTERGQQVDQIPTGFRWVICDVMVYTIKRSSCVMPVCWSLSLFARRAIVGCAVAAKETPTTDEAALTIQKGTSHDEDDVEQEPAEDEA